MNPITVFKSAVFETFFAQMVYKSVPYVRVEVSFTGDFQYPVRVPEWAVPSTALRLLYTAALPSWMSTRKPSANSSICGLPLILMTTSFFLPNCSTRFRLQLCVGTPHIYLIGNTVYLLIEPYFWEVSNLAVASGISCRAYSVFSIYMVYGFDSFTFHAVLPLCWWSIVTSAHYMCQRWGWFTSWYLFY